MKRHYLISIIFIVSMAVAKVSMAQNADSLLQWMDNVMSAPEDMQATVQIVLTNKSGKVKVREAMMKQKGKDKKLYRYTKPKSQAGISTLSLPGDVMWLYMPAFDEPTKISFLAKSQTFTGTDFSYEDMESRSYSARYSPTLLQSGDPENYLLELIPISKKSKYSKILIYLNKTYHYPVKMEYYDNRGNYFKLATYRFVKQGKYWRAEELLMADLKKGHSTRVLITDVKFDQGLSDDEFLVEKLMQ